MKELFVTVLLLAAPALAAEPTPPPLEQADPLPEEPKPSPMAPFTPAFHKGGFMFALQYGPGLWDLKRGTLAPRIAALIEDEAESELEHDAAWNFLGQPVVSHTVSMSLGYNILGHVTIGADITATGWNLDTIERGGGGFIIGKLAWHPLALIHAITDQRPTLGLDVSTFFGVGYGIIGSSRGMDGAVIEWGGQVDYFFLKYVALGFFWRGVFLNFDKYYIDYENRDVAGNTLVLNPVSGGSMWTLGVTLTLRAGE